MIDSLEIASQHKIYTTQKSQHIYCRRFANVYRKVTVYEKTFSGTALSRNVTPTPPRQTTPSPSLLSVAGPACASLAAAVMVDSTRHQLSWRDAWRPAVDQHRHPRCTETAAVEAGDVVPFRLLHGGRELVQWPTSVAATEWSVMVESAWHLVTAPLRETFFGNSFSGNIFPGNVRKQVHSWNNYACEVKTKAIESICRGL